MKKRKFRLHTFIVALPVIALFCFGLNILTNPIYRTPPDQPWAPPIFMHGFLVFPKISRCVWPDGEPQYKIEYMRPLQAKSTHGFYSDYVALYIPTGSTVIVKGSSIQLEDTTTHIQTDFKGGRQLEAVYPTSKPIQRFCQSLRLNLAH